jgi:hypothetical protein
MAPIGLGTFAVVLWTSVLGVLAVFAYELYAIAAELGWVGDHA